MSGLVLSLKPNEKFLVNGAVLTNGPKRGQICVEDNNVFVLRLSDVIHPDDSNSPVKRVYYAIQLILSGDETFESMKEQVRVGLAGLFFVFEGTSVIKHLEKSQRGFNAGKFYSALCALKPVIPIEAEMLQSVGGQNFVPPPHAIAV